jgi:hypothetical protein
MKVFVRGRSNRYEGERGLVSFRWPIVVAWGSLGGGKAKVREREGGWHEVWGGDANGFAHAVKFIFGAVSLARREVASIDPGEQEKVPGTVF